MKTMKRQNKPTTKSIPEGATILTPYEMDSIHLDKPSVLTSEKETASRKTSSPIDVSSLDDLLKNQ